MIHNNHGSLVDPTIFNYDGDNMLLDYDNLPEKNITSPRPPRINRFTDKRNFESQANLAAGDGSEFFN